MFNQVLERISEEFSGANAKGLISGIAHFHRIQSSPGFRAAAKFCYNKLVDFGIPKVELLTFPAKGKNTYWGVPVPKEWVIKRASLDLIEPKEKAKNLCRFLDDPCSIIQRSKGTPKEGITGEVVILERGLKEEEIEKLDLKGKFILTDDPDLRKLREIAVKKAQAAGIIYDLVSEFKPLRTRANFPTARRYTSFWYDVHDSEGDALGFVLSAELGDELRALIKQQEERRRKDKKDKEECAVKVHAEIDAYFIDGAMEVVEFFIPGTTDEEEVLAVAHLCHPKPGAIDNASGCGTLMEVARTLQTLISTKKLPRPKRGMRFLLMAEFTGTVCYLATHEKIIEKFVAGINADMVGADQSIGGGRTLVMERTHDSCPSFVNDVLSAILHERSKEVKNFTGTGAFATFKYANDQPFSGGSDHFILGFPDIGIGTPMLIQWPDRFYHTGEDTIEKVSEEMLAIVGSLIGTYCYFIANAGYPEVLWLIQEVGSKARERIIQFAREYANSIVKKMTTEEKQEEKEKQAYMLIKNVEKRITFRKEREILTLRSTKKLLSKEQMEKEEIKKLLHNEEKLIIETANKELARLKKELIGLFESLKLTPKEPNGEKESLSKEDRELIPVKQFRGPITGLHRLTIPYEELHNYEKLIEEHKELTNTIDAAIFWINGKRTFSEICALVEAELGKVDEKFLFKILSFYEKHRLIKLKKKEKKGN
ncbi:hypothetical protein DRO91_02700 [Candidatus Heimdallarchaeota archaeon]|nr:MAG: hypothetical protein DRO63_01965 [Candidatus Gerdarchaeota archaeon]RLI71748.1 MAG: hypothetical protein DRP02_03770 [Candidatus Gerdarchaeota archaeon]RLI73540.1 MAG: hypothetical protein DRO91_02700 [Candidatus Heimdallarchaeota archaeon]